MNQYKNKVFIVDDEPLFSMMLSDYLTQHNPSLKVKSFMSGEACLEALYENPALIILDHYLSSSNSVHLNGLDMLSEIKKTKSHPIVVMLSGQESYFTAAKAIGLGALHYVIKDEKAFEKVNRIIKANI
ncbi:response regulator [Mangrovimonas sp. DI 80]|uniref:response regulator n=1 Tax=Mangrovimonas sp. DI 80 TaxID=1779330 RepID=UPI000977C51C|nr:response regulator [Mangrovimonas sp. DI 80]OMP30812.1 hypothetical protein BKM32_11320 [Mangrovimonas sp. DI 80]